VVHAYGDKPVLHGVDLVLNPGEIYALLGPNGAGKTTLIKTICGRIRPDGGAVALNGQDPARVPSARACLGLVPQEIALYAHLTVAENLAAFASLAQVPRRAVPAAVQRAMALTRTATGPMCQSATCRAAISAAPTSPPPSSTSRPC
jgi:ABC-2 type transport system ATP-binding protein